MQEAEDADDVEEASPDGDPQVLTADAPDRCAAHPGSRNELWCETCEAAICGHCERNAAHQAHAVVKLSAAYDDAFEAIEAMQVEMVRSLTETRQRSTLLDAVLMDLGTDYEVAQQALDQQVRRDAGEVEAAFEQAQARLQARVDECREWRGGIEETLRTVQMMVEEFPPAQMVMRRGRILALLEAVERVRPADWWAPLPPAPDLADLVQPAWHYTSLHVPMVLELGRKRGHVRVAGDPFSAHGMVWCAEARRSRGPLGDACLLVVVSCTEGCDTSAVAVSVHIAAGGGAGPHATSSALELLRQPMAHEQQKHFWAADHAHEWTRNAAREFTVCALPELEDAQVLDGAGGVTVRVGVRPASFKELSRVQGERIRALEEQVDELRRQRQDRPASVGEYGGPDAALSVRPNRQRPRDASDVRGWATSPRPAATARVRLVADPLSYPAGSPRTPVSLLSSFGFASSRQPGVFDSPTLLVAPLADGAGSLQLRPSPETLATSPRRRATSSQVRGLALASVAASPLRIGGKLPVAAAAPTRPISRLPALAAAGRVPAERATSMQIGMFGIAGSGGSKNRSQVSVAHSQPEFSRPPTAADDGRPGSMLRRLSGWVRTKEGRVSQQAKRVRQQLAVSTIASAAAGSAEQPGTDDIGDWTFLDGTSSPGFPRSASYNAPAPARAPAPAPLPAAPGASHTLPRRAAAPPAIPLPPVPAAEPPEADDDGFAFDGAADIEREQALVDARAAVGGGGGGDGLRARYDSILQRVDALQLIANTVENSRDGFSEGTLRRISSELGVLRDGRMRRFAEARALASGLSPPGPVLPAVGGLRRALDDADIDLFGSARRDETPVVGRKKSATFATDCEQPLPSPTLSAHSGSLDGLAGGLLAESLERLDIGSAPRRHHSHHQRQMSSDSSNSSAPPAPLALQQPRPLLLAGRSSISIDAVRSPPPPPPPLQQQLPSSESLDTGDEGHLAPEHLTPQATRRGGILKAGRSMRVAPARLLEQLPVPLAAIDIRTPQGAGRFTEYESGTSMGGASPLAGKSARSATLPPLAGRASTSAAARRALDTPPVTPLPTKAMGGGGRQARSARALRKCVRFPEEQRLLETIRLIDPQAARSIESRAARDASDDLAASLLPPPPPFNLGAEEDGSRHSVPHAGLGLAVPDADDIFSVGGGPPLISPDSYSSATSLLQLLLSDGDECAGCVRQMHTNARGQAVGPNPGSAHSSPAMAAQALGPANCSPSPPLAAIDG